MAGERLTYEKIAERTGIAKQTLHTIGSRDDYNATLELIEKLCRLFGATPGDLLELIDAPPEPKSKPKPKHASKKK